MPGGTGPAGGAYGDHNLDTFGGGGTGQAGGHMQSPPRGAPPMAAPVEEDDWAADDSNDLLPMN